MPTIDMSSWPSRTVDVLHGIMLDPENVRLGVPSTASQAEVMVDLFVNENAMELVRSILQVGFLTLESVIALERDGDLVVVEGNRRMAALKAIQNPELAPGQFVGRVKRLVEGSSIPLDTLSRITVRVAPDQEQANELIATVHTGRQRKPWSRARQAEFFQAQVNEGKSVQDLVVQFPTVPVRDLLVRSSVLQRLRDVSYKDPELAKYVNSGKFPVTVLERFYPNKDFRDLVGLSIDSEGATAKVTSTEADFAAMSERLVANIKDKKITTRTLNRVGSRQYREALEALAEAMGKELPAKEPPTEEKGVEPSSASMTPAGKSEGGSSQKATKAPASRRVRTPVMPERLVGISAIEISEGYYPSVYQLREELMMINVRVHPNATVDLLRTFLEKAIKVFARRHPDSEPFKDVKGKKQLEQMLDWLAIFYSKRDTDLHQAVQALQSIKYGKSSDGTVVKERLDAINHNPAIVATETDAHDVWNAICPVIADILGPRW